MLVGSGGSLITCLTCKTDRFYFPNIFMKKTYLFLLISLISTSILFADGHGWTSLFDGKTFDGWKISKENPGSFVIEEGAFVTRGERAHLFYDGPEAPFKNFELKVDVLVEHNSNGGIYFHTKYQEEGWPTEGFECQVNVSQKDWKKTGSLYNVVNLATTPAQDNTWWTQHIKVEGNEITVRINDLIVLQYTQPEGAKAGDPFTRVLNEGTFGLQCHDPGSVVKYKNIRVKRLPN